MSFSDLQRKTLQQQLKSALEINPLGYSEFELLQLLEDSMPSSPANANSTLTLFQRHFALMHCLYRLREQLWQSDGVNLKISPTHILIEQVQETKNQDINNSISPTLRDYYLNWENFHTSSEEVDGLLNQFWQDYAKYISQDEAWAILDLPIGSSKDKVRERYRELAAKHHPDKGGEQEQFVKIRAAYEILKANR